jgi:hypothetical protein
VWIIIGLPKVTNGKVQIGIGLPMATDIFTSQILALLSDHHYWLSISYK